MDAPPAQNPVQQGDHSFAQGNYADAANSFRQAVAANPANATAWKSLCLSLIALRDFDQAIEAGRKAADLQPGNAEVRYAYGYAFGASGRYDEAIRELDAALQLQPNHASAKQALIYSLVQMGDQRFHEDPYEAEKYLDRAHKLDQRNPHVIAKVLNLYLFMGQKGKAITLYKELSDSQKNDPTIKASLEKMEQNAEFKTSMQQAQMQQQVARPALEPERPTQQAIQQIPCPNCRQMIMDYAAICPHCNYQIRQYGTFAGRDTGPDRTWQEIAYVILSVIWCLLSVLRIVEGFMMESEGMKAFLVTIGAANLGVGIGLLCRTEWLQFIAKILCYLNILGTAVWTMIGLFGGAPIAGLINLAMLSVYCFMVYLINYEGG